MFERSKRLVCFGTDIALTNKSFRRYCGKLEPYLDPFPRVSLLVADRETRRWRDRILYGSDDEKRSAIKSVEDSADPRGIYVLFTLTKFTDATGEYKSALYLALANKINTRIVPELNRFAEETKRPYLEAVFRTLANSISTRIAAEITRPKDETKNLYQESLFATLGNILRTRTSSQIKELMKKTSEDKTLSPQVKKVAGKIFEGVSKIKEEIEKETLRRIKKDSVEKIRSNLIEWAKSSAAMVGLTPREAEERVERDIMPSVSKAVDVWLELSETVSGEQLTLLIRQMVLDGITKLNQPRS